MQKAQFLIVTESEFKLNKAKADQDSMVFTLVFFLSFFLMHVFMWGNSPLQAIKSFTPDTLEISALYFLLPIFALAHFSALSLTHQKNRILNSNKGMELSYPEHLETCATSFFYIFTPPFSTLSAISIALKYL